MIRRAKLEIRGTVFTVEQWDGGPERWVHFYIDEHRVSMYPGDFAQLAELLKTFKDYSLKQGDK